MFKLDAISSLIFLRIGAGVFAGAMMPNQESYWNSGIPASANVGTFGRAALRFEDAKARARTLSVWIRPWAVLRKAKLICASPRIMLVSCS